MGTVTALLSAAFAAYILTAFLFVLIFGLSSLREKESFAARRSLWLAIVFLAAACAAVLLFPNPIFRMIAALLAASISVAAAYFLIPSRKTAAGTAPLIKGHVERVDERDNIWARARTLHPNREDRQEYKIYYEQLHPERKERDDKIFNITIGDRGCVDKANFHNKMIGGIGINRFMTKLGTADMVLPQVNVPNKKYARELSPRELTGMIKGLCKQLGADLVGVAELNPLWVYSRRGQIHQGNWQDWGKELPIPHKYVVVFGFGMDLDLVRTAPFSPCDLEVYHQYAKAVVVSVQMAHCLASMGYEAKAHHLRAQDIMLVPAAVDAGLGQVSRCGNLITREFGTRLRLGAITTDAQLVVDQPVDLGVTEFCEACAKCARQCPLGAIPRGSRTIVNGSLRWPVDPEKCYEYWTKSGTHCSLCQSCCPWSHDDSLIHRALKTTAVNCYRMHPIMVWADDFFYGKKINSRLGPKWIDFRHQPGKEIMLDQEARDKAGSRED